MTVCRTCSIKAQTSFKLRLHSSYLIFNPAELIANYLFALGECKRIRQDIPFGRKGQAHLLKVPHYTAPDWRDGRDGLVQPTWRMAFRPTASTPNLGSFDRWIVRIALGMTDPLHWTGRLDWALFTLLLALKIRLLPLFWSTYWITFSGTGTT